MSGTVPSIYDVKMLSSFIKNLRQILLPTLLPFYR
jgi:hypothetical protein